MLSRWPVVTSVPLQATDRDDEGRLTDAALERILSAGRAAYAELCQTIDWPASEVAETTVRRGAVAVASDAVTVSVNVVEVYPESVTMAVRIRPAEADEIAADARCTVLIGSGVTPTIRDELIAIAQNARYMH